MYKIEKFFIYLYLIPFALDFKGAEEGGSNIQFLLLGVVLLSGAFLLFHFVKLKSTRRLPKSIAIIIFLWWGFLISSVFTAVFNEVPMGNYIRIILPYFLTGLSILIVLQMYLKGRDLGFLLTPILWTVCISVVWTALYAIFILKIPIATMRYQILSPLLITLIGYAIAQIIEMKKVSKFTITILSVCTVLIVLSVTRSTLVSIAFMILFVIIAAPLNERLQLFKKFILTLKPLILVLVISIPAISIFRENSFNEWRERLFTQRESLGVDVTTVTRLAEYSGQLDLLFETNATALLGRGVGSVYVWDSDYFNTISMVIDINLLSHQTYWANGHSLWVYSLYSGGLLFGWLVPFCALYSLVLSFKNIRKKFTFGHLENSTTIVFFCLINVAIFSATFTANPLGVRLVGVIYGLGIGLSILYFQQTKEILRVKDANQKY
ncbi:hypothetical protein AB6T38_09645 [Aliiglaciecola sp. SL4]|uniref:hypothetical protein n=1 Tax=Aliiglaciecola sp. SL4 TaxID=3239806 RepID=UPI00355BABD2